MQLDYRSAMIVFLVAILTFRPVENASSIVAIVRLLASLEPYGRSREANASSERMCKCEEQLPASATSYDVSELMKDVKRLLAKGVSPETILDTVQLSIHSNQEESERLEHPHDRTKHSDQEEDRQIEILIDTKLQGDQKEQVPVNRDKAMMSSSVHKASGPIVKETVGFSGPDNGLVPFGAPQSSFHETHAHTYDREPDFPPFLSSNDDRPFPSFQNLEPPRDVKLVVQVGDNEKKSVSFPAQPSMTLWNAMKQAETEFDYEYDLSMMVEAERDRTQNCYVLGSVAGTGNTKARHWVIYIYDNHFQKVYEGSCISGIKIIILPGYMVHLKYETHRSHEPSSAEKIYIS